MFSTQLWGSSLLLLVNQCLIFVLAPIIIMSALTNSLDALVSRVSDALSSPSNRSPLITAGALASILSVYAISRSRFDDPTLPEISPAPEPQKDGPYPYDFYEGGK